MGEVSVSRRGYRSLFWPIVLIAIGVIWLLGNMGVLSGANIMVLLRLWPLLLIVVGLDLLFGRQSPVIGAAIGVGAVVLIVALMFVGPSMGLAGPSLEVTVDQFEEPREDATSADIQLDLAIATATIHALTDSANLFTAEVSHIGELEYAVEGEAHKTIRLRQEETQENGFTGLDFLVPVLGVDREKLYWNIGLDPTIPLNLTIQSGVGTGNFDLSELQLQQVAVNGGVGAVNLSLPAMTDSYDVSLNSGVGEFNITIAEDAALNINVSGGVGNVTIDVPEDAAVRVDGSSGVGAINVPGGFERVGGDPGPANEGTWETVDFSAAERQISINFSGGVGSLTIR